MEEFNSNPGNNAWLSWQMTSNNGLRKKDKKKKKGFTISNRNSQYDVETEEIRTNAFSLSGHLLQRS